VLACVANVSEGRDARVLGSLASACGRALLDVHADRDHHRSVFTIAGAVPEESQDAARRLAGAVADHVDISAHTGVHPRLGALDVVPFVYLTPDARSPAITAAREFARWWSAECGVPIFLYDDADPDRRSLPALRREAFAARKPDLGPGSPHPRLGAAAVGARPPMIAVNCLLTTDAVGSAAEIARHVRERDGGLPGVRALAFELESSRRAQVSMNLVDLDRTGIEAACVEVRRLAREQRIDVESVELVGLMPRRELERCTDEFVAWSGLDPSQTVEARIAARREAASG
jgi:glutamate formiminotransferase